MQSDPQAVVYLALLTLAAILGLIVVVLIWQSERRRANARIESLLQGHEKDLLSARKDSVERARSSLKGQIAEQMAPLLPGFPYRPADARFLGDPIDYVVFDGYTGLRDEGAAAEDPGDRAPGGQAGQVSSQPVPARYCALGRAGEGQVRGLPDPGGRRGLHGELASAASLVSIFETGQST